MLYKSVGLWKRSPVWIICRGLGILIVSGLAGATLVRLAPGFGIAEQALDSRLSAQSLKALEHQHEGERNPLAFYVHFLGGLLGGNAGRSAIYGQPVGQLVRERAPTTIRTAIAGLAGGWTAAVVLATAAALSRNAAFVLPAMGISGALLSIPSAVLATICLLLRLHPAVAIAAVVLPRVLPYAYEQLRAGLSAPPVLMARAMGLSGARVFLFHVVPAAVMPLVALAGVSVTLAFGASIPIEALADSPGMGQLAWQAALGRDLPVLVTVTLLLTAITVFSNVAADLAVSRLGRRPA